MRTLGVDRVRVGGIELPGQYGHTVLPYALVTCIQVYG
jgi:hypothetical protein